MYGVLFADKSECRGNDFKNALLLLETQFQKEDRPTLKQLTTMYNKCIQLEDQEALAQLKRLCSQERKYKPTDWRFRK